MSYFSSFFFFSFFSLNTFKQGVIYCMPQISLNPGSEITVFSMHALTKGQDKVPEDVDCWALFFFALDWCISVSLADDMEWKSFLSSTSSTTRSFFWHLKTIRMPEPQLGLCWLAGVHGPTLNFLLWSSWVCSGQVVFMQMNEHITVCASFWFKH